MKINPIQSYISIQKITNEKVHKADSSNEGSVSHLDRVTVSEEAKLFSAALNAAKEAADIRTEKTMQIQARIKNGSYNVEPSDVAEQMIKSIMTYKEIQNKNR